VLWQQRIIGCWPSLVASGRRPRGLVYDPPRPEANKLMTELRNMGVPAICSPPAPWQLTLAIFACDMASAGR